MAHKVQQYYFDITLVSGEQSIEDAIMELLIQRLDSLMDNELISDLIEGGS